MLKQKIFLIHVILIICFFPNKIFSQNPNCPNLDPYVYNDCMLNYNQSLSNLNYGLAIDENSCEMYMTDEIDYAIDYYLDHGDEDETTMNEWIDYAVDDFIVCYDDAIDYYVDNLMIAQDHLGGCLCNWGDGCTYYCE